MVKVILATGGSGGHIFPAIALRDELIKQDYEVIIIADYRYKKFVKNIDDKCTYILSIDNIKKNGILHKCKSILKLCWSLLQAFVIFVKIKPDIVIGFGGYPSFPTMLIARIFSIKTIIHEQNIVLGRANRFLIMFVDIVATSFPEVIGISKKYLSKTFYTGNPVRSEISNLSMIEYSKFDEDNMINILVLGGSQGAEIFSKIVPGAIALLPLELQKKIKVTQQSKENDISFLQEKYKNIKITSEIASFFEDIADKLSKSTIVIARSGASTLFELLTAARPAILVPYPYATDNHQYYNGDFYVKIGAGIAIKQQDFTSEVLADQLNNLFNNETILHEYVANAKKHQPNACKNLISIIASR